MFSVMNTGTWRLPSCTAMVRPSMSGMIVEALDQVRITCRDGLFLAISTFLANFSCTYGPFFIDLDILSFLLLTVTAESVSLPLPTRNRQLADC
jgi:hypothetical protein